MRTEKVPINYQDKWWSPMQTQKIDLLRKKIYIYICCRVKTWSKNSLFLSQNLVQFFFFFLFLFFKNPLLSAGRMRFLRKTSAKKREKKTLFLRQNLVQFCCATYLDQVLTQPWTKFWLNNFADFWLFLSVWKDAETTIFIVFSAKN